MPLPVRSHALTLGRLIALVICAVVLGAPSPARAKIACPPNCDVPSRIVVAPSGTAEFVATIRDVSDVPIADVEVELDLSNIPSLSVATCPDCEDAPAYDPLTKRITARTDAAGVVRIALCGAILCDETAPSSRVVVLSEGVWVRPITIATLDLSVNGLVDSGDLALWDVRAAAGDLLGDYDGDGDLDGADRAFLAASIGEHCDAAIPVQATSWGRLKVFRR